MFNLKREHFRDDYLYRFYQYGDTHSKIPSNLYKVLARKLDMISVSENINDLRS
ncbi:TPA: type II toxin-antitoxin system RelE/ParE family toxin, partial [Haemophilus influenzae]